MRRRLTWLALAALPLCVACGAEGQGDEFRVAFLTAGSIADGGWNAGASVSSKLAVAAGAI